jgi:3-hydroxyisobutyrate dehydrogenase/glyoxylate/succinic semialdehyde reductase
MKIAFIGLGIMGSRMATNLAKQQVNLTVYNRTAAASQAVEAHGAHIAHSPTAAVTSADVVFTMLSTPQVIKEVAMGTNGFVQSMKQNAIWVDCSTVNPSFTQELHQFASQQGIRYLECPVSGSKLQAENGELIFFAGGTGELVSQVTFLLEYMGKRIIHAGDTGKGAATKMLVNGMLAQAMLVFGETLMLGEKMGLSREFLLDLLPKLPVSAPFLQFKAEKIRKENWEEEFPLEWMQKDLHLLTLSAYENQVAMPAANLAKELYMKAVEQGFGRNDFSAIVKSLDSGNNK